MNSNLLILPILLPLLCALLLVFTKNKNRVSKILYIGTMTVNTLISLALLIYVMNHNKGGAATTSGTVIYEDDEEVEIDD